MANLQAISNTVNNVDQMELPIFQHADYVSEKFSTSQRWTYLVSNNIRFVRKQPYTIQLPKPAQKDLTTWIEKIIVSGQCSTLFIEQLRVDEISLQRINSYVLNLECIWLIYLTKQLDKQM